MKNWAKKIILIVLFLTTLSFAQRVVSLAPPVTAQLTLLGADSLLVGRTSFCKGVQNSQIVGDVMSISGESILALRPDIVFAGGLTNASLIERLRRVGVNVVVISDPQDYKELSLNFRKIANSIGANKKADSILAKTDSRVKEMKNKNKTLTSRPAVFIQLSTNPVFTIMTNTLGNEMITLAGGQNAFNLTGGAQVSLEAVIGANPDLIIIADMGTWAQAELRSWARFRGLSAVRENRLHIIDANLIGSPTPVSFIETVEQIRSWLNFGEGN